MHHQASFLMHLLMCIIRLHFGFLDTSKEHLQLGYFLLLFLILPLKDSVISTGELILILVSQSLACASILDLYWFPGKARSRLLFLALSKAEYHALVHAACEA